MRGGDGVGRGRADGGGWGNVVGGVFLQRDLIG